MKEVNLPIKKTNDLSYTILDTTEGKIYLAINHIGESSKFTNIYISDYQSLNFTLSLMNSVRDAEGNVDFERMFGSVGTYIANAYETDKLDQFNAKKAKKV